MPVELPILRVAQTLAERAAAHPAVSHSVVGPWGSARTAVAFQTARTMQRSALIVASGRIEAEAVYEDLCTFAGPEASALFPAWEVMPGDIMAPSDDIVAERMDTLMRLAEANRDGRPMYVAVSVRALLQAVVKREQFLSHRLTITAGEEYDLEQLLEELIDLGYSRELMVEQRGEMSVRGGILDVFAISGELPYRIEFFGDEVESIRCFEPETQRSVERVESVSILPRSEKAMLASLASSDGAPACLTDYFPDETLVVMDEPLNVLEEAETVERRMAGKPHCLTWRTFQDRVKTCPQVSLAQLAHEAVEGERRITEPMGAVSGWTGEPEGFWRQLDEWEREEYTVILICNNTGERRRLFELLDEHGHNVGRGPFDLRVEVGRLQGGFASATDRLAVLSEREIFGRHYVRRTRRRFEAGAGITAFSDLRGGDYIVHVVHGIGRYEGLRRFPGKGGDFLCIRYAGGDKLYVPAGEIDQVQKYVGGDGGVPRIDRLGGASWARTKKKVKKALHDMTEELIKLYASREAHEGHAFSPDTVWQREFEDAFEYDETVDQARAIEEVKRDMESPRPMDRLLCGDVGYGKTEVALRAAFKAVMDRKQVALLVPTTILAQQHYATFSERLADYPVSVSVLSRFESPAKQRQTIERLKSGEVDIVIGTHRLTSKDIKFKDLGLLIIDEEQKFGVAQKEKIKHLRTSVDVLTMTATPIPRTLHLSLMGSRDMSVINTAPNDRLPVHTCIETFDDALIKEAIEREIAREGQVFFLHNRVQTIISVAEYIQRLLPQARIGVAHGQMPERKLAQIMTAFVRDELDILVSTTIIGSGLDIPNANTIIMNRADYFGLAELYQLRGRVGRYKHRAFAYLLIPGDRVPTEEAQKRLKALEEFSTLGAGFRIAMRDLEIRGCGNILGGEQHGHIAAVGYETYTNLLHDAVRELRGETVRRRILPPFDFSADAVIPEAYVPSEAQKITLYKRISSVQSVEAADEMLDELTDRFGRPPAPVKRLVAVMRLRALAADIGVKAMSAGQQTLNLVFHSSDMLPPSARDALKARYGKAVELTWQEERLGLTLKMDEGADLLGKAARFLDILAELQE